MGRPKLILPMADGRALIGVVIDALKGGGAGPILLIVPPFEEPGAVELARIGECSGAVVVPCPDATADMKATVLLGLERLESDVPGILLSPGDALGITAETVVRVRRAFEEDPDRVVVPTFQARRGHPVALPRSLRDRIAALPTDQGIDTLIRDPATRVRELPVDAPGIADDLDTPDDYQRWINRNTR